MDLPSEWIARFWSNVQKADGDGCWLYRPGATSRSQLRSAAYPLVRCNGARLRAHQWSWVVAHGPVPSGLCVLHRCDVPRCVRPDHLFLGTLAENNADRDRKGRQATGDRTKPWLRARGERHGSRTKPASVPRGERHPHARLSASDVVEIRRLRTKEGLTQQAIADRFGLSQAHVSEIVRGTKWASVPAATDAS